MGGIGYQHLAPAGLASLLEPAPDHHDATELAMGACRRLERHRVHAGDFLEVLTQFVDELKRSLGRVPRRERVNVGEAGKPRGALVDFGVVLHRARAEGVETAVDVMVEGREPDKVAGDVDFTQLGQVVVGPGLVAERRRRLDRRNVQRGQGPRPAAGPGKLEDALFRVHRLKQAANRAAERS